jgi:hypothetical protein
MTTGNALPRGYVLPNPGPPKMIGILNIVFSSMLLLCGLCQGAGALISPMIMDWFALQQKRQEAAGLESQKAMVEAETARLDARAKKATTADEKAIIEAERTRLKSLPKPYVPNVAMGVQLAKDWRLQWFNWADIITAIAINVPMLISGIGLLRLREWARKLALATFAIKIPRLLILFALAVALIVPLTAQATRREMDKLAAQIQAQQGNNPNTKNIQKTLSFATMLSSVSTTVSYVALYGGGLIYPIVGLLVLTRPGARAACLVASKPPKEQGELS